jgi:hypothetical protein
LKKLYEKRTVLDKQILEVEKSLVDASSAPGVTVPKSAGPPKRKAPAPKRPLSKKKES